MIYNLDVMRILNKRAYHKYNIEEHLEGGLVLTGSEVKSIRAGRIDLTEAHIKILSSEAFLVNAQFLPLQTTDKSFESARSRKVLLHRAQIDSLIGKTSQKGVVLVPLSLYEKDNKFKIEIGIGKSKKEYDHRKSIKEKDNQRRMEQELRGKE